MPLSRSSGWIFVIATLQLVACAARQPAQDGQAAMVRAARQTLDEAFKKRDFAAYVETTAEGVSISGPAWRSVGRDQLKDGLTGLTKRRPDLLWSHVSREVRVYDNWEVAYENGDWHETWREPDGQTTLDGKYTGLWRKEEDRWVLSAEVFVPLSCTGKSYCQ